MIRDYSKKYSYLSKTMNTLGMRIPETINRFTELHKASNNEGVLSSKTKELIVLGIDITVRCEGCIAFHVQDSLQAGPNSQEIMETIGVTLIMDGSPSGAYGCKAKEALDQFKALEKNLQE